MAKHYERHAPITEICEKEFAYNEFWWLELFRVNLYKNAVCLKSLKIMCLYDFVTYLRGTEASRIKISRRAFSAITKMLN